MTDENPTKRFKPNNASDGARAHRPVKPSEFDGTKLSMAPPPVGSNTGLGRVFYDGVPLKWQHKTSCLFGIAWWDNDLRKMKWTRDYASVPPGIKSFNVNFSLTGARNDPQSADGQMYQAVQAYRKFIVDTAIKDGWVKNRKREPVTDRERVDELVSVFVFGDPKDPAEYIDNEGKTRTNEIALTTKCYANERNLPGEMIDLSVRLYNINNTGEKLDAWEHLRAKTSGVFTFEPQPISMINGKINATLKVVGGLIEPYQGGSGEGVDSLGIDLDSYGTGDFSGSYM